jgi:presenilin-like A22 family membrane protease
MILVLSAMVFILRRFPRIFDTINEAAVFFSFFVLPYTFRKKRTASSVATKLFFAGEIVFATVATRYWETHPNWITNNICAFVVGIVILLTFRTITDRQCAAVSLGIMAFDAVSVFVSGQMQPFAEAAGDHAGASIAIPAGLSPANPSVFSIGLGDLVVPGFVVLLAYRTYGKRGAAGAIAGYLAGMLVALVVLLISDSTQPATIYLVPGAYFGFWIATARIRKRQLA